MPQKLVTIEKINIQAMNIFTWYASIYIDIVQSCSKGHHSSKKQLFK